MYPHTKREMKRKFGLILTDIQLESYAAKHKVLRKDLQQDVCDSFDRDYLIHFIVEDVLGEDYHWPINGDGVNYAVEFYPKFFTAAQEKGIEVDL